MKKRAILIAKGKVQKVGYRDYVQEVARELAITGYVENLKDGCVRIVCEADDELIKRFIELTKIKKDFIDVKDIELKETSEATGEFEYFDIKYGSLEDELGERMGAGILYIGATRNEVKQVGEKVDKVGEKVDKVGKKVDKVGKKVDKVGKKVDKVGKKVDSMHGDMNKMFGKLGNTIVEKFDALDEKYHVVSETLKSINENQRIMQEEFVKSRQELTRVVDKLALIVDRFIENEKNKKR